MDVVAVAVSVVAAVVVVVAADAVVVVVVVAVVVVVVVVVVVDLKELSFRLFCSTKNAFVRLTIWAKGFRTFIS